MTEFPTLSETTARTRDWLDRVHSTPAERGGYRAHEPVFGFGSRDSTPHQAPRLARTGRLLRLLAADPPETLLDMGACEGYTADLIREFLGTRAATCDLSGEACLRAREWFGLPSFACEAGALPLADGAFEVVLCSEVVEHLEDPFAAIAELMRVARRMVVISTMECCRLESERRLMLRLRNFETPHLERNWWMPRDFGELLGAGVETHRQIRLDDPPSDRERDMARLKRWLNRAADPRGIEREGSGVIVIRRMAGGAGSRAPVAIEDDALWETLIRPRPMRATEDEVDPNDAAWLRERLRCPTCLSELREAGGALRCDACAREFAPYRGVAPDLTIAPSEARRGASPLETSAVERLRALFSPANVSKGAERFSMRRRLACVEFARDLLMRRGARRSWRAMCEKLRAVKRDLDPKAEGRLVRARGEPAIYRIEGGKRRHIASERAFFDMGHLLEQVQEVEPEWLERFEVGAPIVEADARDTD